MRNNLFTTLMGIIAMTGFIACSSSGDDVNDINHDLIAVPDYQSDTWVTDDDIKSEDLDLLIDLATKVEFMRLDFIQMLSNNFEGDKLFCGIGDKTNTKPTIDCFTNMMVKEDEYLAALDRLDATRLMTPTSSTRGGEVGNVKKIFTAGRKEQTRVYNRVMGTLDKMKIWSDDQAQQELYDFYKRLEPDYAKQIDAKDARDFFKRLNTGDLNAYIINIDQVWSVNGSRETNAVGNYGTVGFTGNAEYMKSAYRVSSQVAVATGELYFNGIDRFTGGYGSKIIELGDALKKKIEYIKLREKVMSGNLDLQEINTVIVNQISEDIKGAISEALGDDKDFGDELVEQITGEICDYVAEQYIAESAEKASGDENTIAKKKDDAGKATDKAVIDIITDFNSKTNLVIITDDSTGKVIITKPNDQGHAIAALDPGGKTITVINSKGERLTKHVTVEEGLNTVDMQTKKFSIYTNPFEISIDSKGGDEYATVVTNCKYVQQRITKQEDWWKSKIDISGKYIRLTIYADPNTEEKSRSGSLVLEAYDDNSADAKPVATYTVKFTQDANTPKPQGSLKVSPTTLSFDANGGTKRIEMETDGYEYYGGFAEDDSESWITCTTSNNGVNVTVSANTTGNKRTGNVYAFVTNTTNAQSLDDVTYAIVKVTQEANAEEPEQPEVTYELVSGSVRMYYAIAWRWETNFKPGDDGVTITPNGKGAKVVINQEGTDLTQTWHSTISFEIDDLGLNDSNQAKISHFKFELEKNVIPYQYYDFHIDSGHELIRMEAPAPEPSYIGGLWSYSKDDLSYYSKSTIHYDRWRLDPYSAYTEHTEESETSEVTDGSYVSIGLTVKKK